ncbi:diaminopimelate epimerase [Actinomadura madurae]|uniref:diaminopimelate epimerase n=1 Tax=Actinomadura madurae TaxID=1993 RepID=UPI0020270A5D|nr:diaminopimelate epimerase [Actinomadura madurae]MCP9954578.1 diaminopimelate epimerase [Actinomadura madurae]MCP9971315.1 diaminopimelate epimerase [Actinomadura madurae]MCP9983804.1 diaminopimelate epimerase [Actinomadura madurae]MCQ0004627.1 diaminopimelate epimerase [Actinomadura madurae]URN00072.1 diaminopimelate epimerase [Actinomadura madurae]
MRFVKGHGTENDFVILPDPDGVLDLTPDAVARLCDRRAGIGADGVLRAVRTKAAEVEADAEWFMDYRNSDGGIAEMCGNGIRVFARYLVDEGLAAPGEWDVATRAGLRRVTLGPSGDVSVDMGPPELLGRGEASLAGTGFTGERVSVGNPHLACRVDGPVAALDLSRAPDFDPAAFPEGVNVEFFRPLGERHVEMRVYERGSGETRSCGTGTVAVAAAASFAATGGLGGSGGAAWTVDVPGGRVTVTLDGETSHLKGPAVLVAEGETRPGWI